MGTKRSFIARLAKSIRLLLAWIMLIGNPGSFLGFVFSTPVRLGLMAFAATVITSSQAFGREVRKKFHSDKPVVVFENLSGLSDNPTDSDLEQVRLFEIPFIPTSNSIKPDENADLAKALKADLNDPKDETLSNLGAFTLSHPNSRWVLSVELNRGLLLRQRGYYSRSVEAFQKAWEAGKNESGTQGEPLWCKNPAEVMRSPYSRNSADRQVVAGG